jgi:hypothetical protein
MEKPMKRLSLLISFSAFLGVAISSLAFAADDSQGPPVSADGEKLNALAPANLAHPRPAAPFDLTGIWTTNFRWPENQATGGYEFFPLPKLKPEAAALYAEKEKAFAAGKTFRDDAGLCFPPGMPRTMTRVWPMMIMQYPTVIVMVSGFDNALRQIYIDGRGHTDYDYLIPSYQGDSIGRWEGKTLVVTTVGLEPERHWMQQGIPMSEELFIEERFTVSEDGKSMKIDMTFTDPINWEGEWKTTKHFRFSDTAEVTEVNCLPSITNEGIEGL